MVFHIRIEFPVIWPGDSHMVQAMQHLREVLTVATDLALENSIVAWAGDAMGKPWRKRGIFSWEIRVCGPFIIIYLHIIGGSISAVSNFSEGELWKTMVFVVVEKCDNHGI